ncbi:MAG: NUDIX hydrolase [Stackebrandtia sp.]
MDEIEKTQRFAAYGLVRRADEILMVSVGRDIASSRRAWMLPGGGVEHGEHPEEAAVREVAEETGLHSRVDKLLHAGSDHRMLSPNIDYHCLYVVYAMTVLGGELTVEIDGTTRLPAWIPIPALPASPVLPAILPALRAVLGAELNGRAPGVPVP